MTTLKDKNTSTNSISETVFTDPSPWKTDSNEAVRILKTELKNLKIAYEEQLQVLPDYEVQLKDTQEKLINFEKIKREDLNILHSKIHLLTEKVDQYKKNSLKNHEFLEQIKKNHVDKIKRMKEEYNYSQIENNKLWDEIKILKKQKGVHDIESTKRHHITSDNLHFSEKKLNTEKEKLVKTEKELVKTEKELSRLKNQLNEVCEQISIYETDIVHWKLEVTQYKTENELLKTENEKLKKDHSNLLNKNQQLQSDNYMKIQELLANLTLEKAKNEEETKKIKELLANLTLERAKKQIAEEEVVVCKTVLSSIGES